MNFLTHTNLRFDLKNIGLKTYLTSAILFVIFAVLPFLIVFYFKSQPLSLVPRINYDDKAHYPVLVNELRYTAALSVSSLKPIPSDRALFANAEGWAFNLDGEYVQLWIFADSNELQRHFSSFSNLGYSYTDPDSKQETKLQWEERPFFFVKNNQLVIFPGDDDKVEGLLSKVVGGKTVVGAEGDLITK